MAYKTEYDGYYATKSGKIITIKVKGGQGRLNYNNPREHCYKLDKDGYKEYLLSHNGKRYYKRGHRLIWETFNGNIENNLTIDHINMNRSDNRLENLRLLTREMNTSIARKGKITWQKYKKHKRRNIFEVIDKNNNVYLLDKKEIIEKFNLNNYDIENFIYHNKMTKKLTNLKITLKRV